MNARTIQQSLRNYRYRIKVRNLRIAFFEHKKAITIQKYLKGYKTYFWGQDQIFLRNQAAIKIISFMKMVVPRKIFLLEYSKIKKAKIEK